MPEFVKYVWAKALEFVGVLKEKKGAAVTNHWTACLSPTFVCQPDTTRNYLCPASIKTVSFYHKSINRFLWKQCFGAQAFVLDIHGARNTGMT